MTEQKEYVWPPWVTPGQRIETGDNLLIEWRWREGVIKQVKGQEVHVALEETPTQRATSFWCFVTEVHPVPSKDSKEKHRVAAKHFLTQHRIYSSRREAELVALLETAERGE